MSGVNVESLTKRFAGKRSINAVDDLSVSIDTGELLVLLGPSGCGKTTTLRCLAGLETPDAGQIALGGEVVFDGAARRDVPPERRDIGMVFQSYALWPNKTVRANIAYPLRARRMKAALKEQGWVGAAAALVDCGDLLDQYPGQLSGGQQQRVALARGIVARPRVILFDEPLSNLDARLRDQVRGELHDLHRRLGFTGVYVTHDQHEAFALGTRVAVMRAGRIEQLDDPMTVYEHPATEYVAGFIGFVNRIPISRRDGGWTSAAGQVSGARFEDSVGGELTLRVRPEALRLLAAHEHAAGVRVENLQVVDVAYAGASFDVMLTLGEQRLRASVPLERRNTVEPGQRMTGVVAIADARFYDERGPVRPIGDAPMDHGG